MPITVVSSIQGLGRFIGQYPGRVDPDSHDVIVWMFADQEAGAASVVKNSGSAGTDGDLTVRYGSPLLQSQGVFSNRGGGVTEGAAVQTLGTDTAGFRTPNDSAAVPSSLEPPAPLTWSGWVYCRGVPSANSHAAVAKAYRLATQGWSDPFWTTLITIATSNVTSFSLTKGGSRIYLQSYRRLVPHVWHHVGWTYDGTTMKGYIDGDIVAQTSNAGTVDYGAHGPYFVGNTYIAAASDVTFLVQDFRVASVVRPASWFRTVYEQAVMQFGA